MGNLSAPDGTTSITNLFQPAAPPKLLCQGVLVYLPGDSERVLTFVGEVEQGNVCTEILHGYSIISNVIPARLDLDTIGDAPFLHGGDTIFRFNKTTHSFVAYKFDDIDNQWISAAGPGGPTIEVGESFYLYHQGADTNWCRTFFIN